MSIMLIGWALSLDIPPNLKVVLVGLADFANDDGYCWPGQASLSAKVNVPERTLRRHLNALESRGLITRTKRIDPTGRKQTDEYQIHVQPPAILAATTGQSEPHHRPTVAGTKDIRKEPSIEPITRHARARQIPEDWEPKSKHFEIAERRKVDVSLEALKFMSWAEANGRTYVNWDAAFANWLLRATPTGGFAPRKPASRDRDAEIRTLLSRSLGLDGTPKELQ